MPAIILSDNGVSSGSAGLKTSGSNDGILAFQTTTAGGTATTAVTINTSQNVGIGTSSPSLKLTVVGNVKAGYEAATGIIMGLAPSGFPTSDVNCYLLWGDATTFGGTNGDLVYIPRTSTTASHRFYTGSGTPAERVRIDASGNLLLGTNTTTANGNFTNALGTAALASVSVNTARAFTSIVRTSASNNAAGNVFGNSFLQGHFYIYVNGASGVNAYTAVYAVATTGNGEPNSAFTLVTSTTRGTSPVSAIAIASDGAGGAVKLRITYINNSGVVTGGSSTVTFVGQIA